MKIMSVILLLQKLGFSEEFIHELLSDEVFSKVIYAIEKNIDLLYSIDKPKVKEVYDSLRIEDDCSEVILKLIAENQELKEQLEGFETAYEELCEIKLDLRKIIYEKEEQIEQLEQLLKEKE